MHVGGDNKCWRSTGAGISQMWDDVATLVRARMNRRIESYKAAGTFPRIMILDGASLYRKLQHPPVDCYHFWSVHSHYKMDRDGQIVNVRAAQLCAEHVFKAAKLAALFFCQPSGGPAAQGGGTSEKTRAERSDGYTLEEATIDELVMHWQDWSPTEDNVPKSVLNTRPFKVALNPVEFPA
eukprot:8376271-Pyramimonas_sp.AAC.1